MGQQATIGYQQRQISKVLQELNLNVVSGFGTSSGLARKPANEDAAGRGRRLGKSRQLIESIGELDSRGMDRYGFRGVSHKAESERSICGLAFQ